MTSLPPLPAVLDTLRRRGVEVPAAATVVLGSYGDSEALCCELLELVRSGRKRATAGLVWAYAHDGEKLPEAADVEIVLDHADEPVLVTRVVEVSVVPFESVSVEFAAREGEGDGSLESWREGHWAFFGRECRRIGRTPSPTMPVVCCVFDLLQVVPPAEGQ